MITGTLMSSSSAQLLFVHTGASTYSKMHIMPLSKGTRNIKQALVLSYGPSGVLRELAYVTAAMSV